MSSLLGFPLNPSIGQQFAIGTKTYVWSGYAWATQSSGSGGGGGTSGVLPVFATDPLTAVNGTIYLNSTSGRVRVFFNSWMNLSTLEELISHRHTYSGEVVFPSGDLNLDGGIPSTTLFDQIYDGGEPGTTVFATTVDSGTIA
jgi:hypothetical protein